MMEEIDPRSGFCSSNSIFYSKRKPLPLPPNNALDVTTFISSRAHRATTAFVDAATARRLTYTQLWRSVEGVAASLSVDMGIRKGNVVLILSPNSIHFPVVCLAVMSLGAIITTTNPLNTTREIAKQIADSKPLLAFTISDLLPKITAAAPSLPIVLMDNDDANNNNIVVALEEMAKKELVAQRVKEPVE